MAAVLILACLGVAACAQTPTSSASKSEPARLEPMEGTDLKRVILSASAAKRLDIQTTPVREAQVSGTPRKVIPSAAVLYDAHGETWTYTSPQPLSFVRHRIRIDREERGMAILSDGPPAGTAVVTVGASELFGVEFEVGH